MTGKFQQTFAFTGTAPFVGDRVESLDSGKYSGFGTVEKVNPKTVSVTLDNGAAVKFPYTLLIPAGADAPAKPVVQVENTFQTMPLGTAVKFVNPRNANQQGAFVVIKHGSTPGTVNLAKVGGDNNRYFRSIGAAHLVRIALQEV